MKFHRLTIAIVLSGLFGTLIVATYALFRSPPFWIQMHRSACYGTCPIYSLTILEDGAVTFEGKAYTLVVGTKSVMLSAEQMEQLRHVVAESDFLTLQVDCCNCYGWTDFPTTVLEIAVGDSLKRISHYHGCRSAPKWLYALEHKIDEATGASRWIGTTPEERREVERREAKRRDMLRLHKDATDSLVPLQPPEVAIDPERG